MDRRLKGIRISLCYQDVISIATILDNVVNNETDKYDLAVLEHLRDQLMEKLNKANLK